jgi:phosphoglycolate phosphatase-like HAD superfamily hydrolase
MGRLNGADIDGVTIDAYGTLATLVDPLPRLQELLPGRDLVEIERAFRAEGSFYAANVQTGRDATTLAQLREACVGVFNDTLGSSLSAEEYIGALVFEPLPGVREALRRLQSLGLTLAVVGNWDFSLHHWLEELGLASAFATVVHAAAKPSPDGILTALKTMQVSPLRALHIGDEPSDEEAARAAGVHFAPAPLAEAVASLA